MTALIAVKIFIVSAIYVVEKVKVVHITNSKKSDTCSPVR